MLAALQARPAADVLWTLQGPRGARCCCGAARLILVPELLERRVSALERGAPRPSSLRFAGVGGGRICVPLLERAAAVGLPVDEGYGLPECGSVVALSRPGRSCWGWRCRTRGSKWPPTQR